MMGRSKAVTKWSILCGTIALVSFLALTGESARTQVTNPFAAERVSVRSDGGQANSASNGPVISGDCSCVAFYSDASNLIPLNSDTNATRDVFLYDRNDATVERVSVNSAGEQANGPSQLQGFRPAIDETCSCVAFSSDATNLVADDTNGRTDVFVRDLSIPETFRASAGALGEPDGASSFPSVSADCGRIAFQSNASNLVEDDSNQTSDIFVYVRSSGALERISVGPGGEEANGASITPAISADGRCVAFASSATNLWPDDTNGTLDVFVACDGVVTCRASVDSAGNAGNDVSFLPAISADGQIVAFKSNASNLVAGDTNGVADVFVHDCNSGATERVSISSIGAQGNDIAIPPSISADGRFVAFGSYASNLIPGQSPRGRSQVYVRDRQTGVTSLVSTTPEGRPGNNSVPDLPPSISLNGEWVAFASLASDLVPGDTNQALDAFVRTNVPGTLATPTPTPVVTVSPTEEPIPCTRDTDCPFGQFCIDEMCVVATPTPRTPCTVDEDCPEGLSCVDGFCTDISTPTPTPPPCMMDEDCPEGSHCRAMVCVPIRECDDEDPELDRVNCRGIRETCVNGACECGGDCNVNGIVSGGELRIMVNIFGGVRDVADCQAGDFNQDGQIFGSELRQAVRNLGLGCPGEGAPLIFGLNRTDEPRTIEISNATGVPGQFVGVTVSLDGGGDVGVTNLDVLFDTTVLEFDLTDPEAGCAIDPRFAGTDTVLEVFAPQTPPTPEGQGRLRLLIWDMMFPGTAYDDGPLATCTFRIRPDAPLGMVPVNGARLEVADLDGNVFGATLTPGSVTVSDDVIPCDSSADCPDGLICGPDDMCIPAPPCMTDGDCPPGHVCGENDICEPVPCTSDDDCPLGSQCGEDDVCVPIPCTSDDDCPPGTSCGDDGFCEPTGCMTDADCPLGSQCGEDGICTPIGCTDDEDCPPGSECGEDDVCVPLPCDTDDDCPAGTVCGEDGMCEPIGCMDDGDCPSGSRCAENGICEPVPCTSDEDCPPGSTCGEDGFCEPVPCSTDDDCPPASTCEDGTCEPIPCTMDSDCPRGSTCGENGICIPTPCTSDEDCPEGSICDLDSGQCVPEGECFVSSDCRSDSREACVDNMCVCAGDCNNDGQVFPNEISLAVGISGGVLSIDQCRAADVSGDGEVFPNEISLAVVNAGVGCPIGD